MNNGKSVMEAFSRASVSYQNLKYAEKSHSGKENYTELHKATPNVLARILTSKVV